MLQHASRGKQRIEALSASSSVEKKTDAMLVRQLVLESQETESKWVLRICAAVAQAVNLGFALSGSY